MRHLCDALGDTGLETKLKMIQEIALMLQFVDFEQMQSAGEGVQLYNTGIVINDTIEELFTLIGEVGKENSEEIQELVAKIPEEVTPENFLSDGIQTVLDAAKPVMETVGRISAILRAGGVPLDRLMEAVNKIQSQTGAEESEKAA